MTDRPFEVGEDVVITDPNFAPRRSKVTRVGRKYAFVANNSRAFDRVTGVVNDRYGHEKLVRVAEFELEQAVEKARNELRSAGINLDWGKRPEDVIEIRTLLDPFIARTKK